MTTTDFFKRDPTAQDSYWATYLAARPDYETSSFYDIVLDYHRRNGNGRWRLAHDIACGPGQVAAKLAKHFDAVVASDANKSHVEVARTRLAGLKNASFLHTAGEAVAQQHITETDAVDMVTVAEAMALMDMPASLSVFHALLEPSKGTLAMWFYGRPHFIGPDGETLAEEANVAYAALADYMFAPDIAANPEMWRGPTQRMHAWFDYVALPDSEWADVKRQKWNFDCVMPFFSPTAGGLDGALLPSQIGDYETCESAVNRTFWAKRWTAREAERFLAVNMPTFDGSRYQGDEYMRLSNRLEEAMGGKDSEMQVTWPVVLILATAK